MNKELHTCVTKGVVMKATILLVALTLCAGCGATPYLDIGAGVKINRLTHDDLLVGSNPTAHFEVGLEFDGKFECGYNHWSHYFDGEPFNNNEEVWKDEIVCRKRFGGK
jgi:hypothetical protein